MSENNILVTGGAGLIGSHLCEALLKKGYRLTCVDNFITGNKANIAHLLNTPQFQLIEADVSQPPALYLPPSLTFQFIFHLASPASPRGYMDNPIATYQVNSFGTHYLLELAQKQHARFLYASTSESYGDPLEHPQKETYWGNVNPVGIRSCYDESKRFGEMACSTWQRLIPDMDIRIIRIFNTYGPRNDPQDGRVVPNFITQALANKPITVFGDGSQTRSFCYVTDLVQGILQAMFVDHQQGLIVNLGNPMEHTILDFANLIKAKTQSTSEIIFKPIAGNRDDDPRQRCPDISRAKQLLHWEPQISLEEGLLPTIEYFQNVPST